MGVNSDRSRSAISTSTALWVVLGVVCLGTVWGVWLIRPDSQPSNVFGEAGTIGVLLAALISLVFASASRGASQGLRRVSGVVAVVLALGSELIALAYFNAARGSADVVFGVLVTAGALALMAAGIRVIRGRLA